MRFQMLGPLRVWDGAAWAPIRAAQQRLMLAILLAEAGGTVLTDRLVDEIWGDRPPRSAVGTVHDYVVRLRRILVDCTDCQLVTRGRGYELVVGDDAVDAAVFERLVAAGRQAATAGDAEQAVALLSEALSLWRGPALADVATGPTVAAFVARLDRRRLRAVEDRVGARLTLGHTAEVVDELRVLVDEYPLHEGLRASLMVALDRGGRRAEALAAYRVGRDLLVAELGIEPGPELREAQRTVLGGGTVRAAAPSLIVPAQLPPDVAGYTGREVELGRLTELLSTVDSDAGPALVATVTGGAGVGKTALAVHWGHRIADRFPDGQLYVNLRGYAAGEPLSPLRALAGFLPALGLAPAEVPTELDTAAALYRSLLSGKRMLVLLDNAREADQVRPLLPASPGCMALVTSRSLLAGLVARDGAAQLPLTVLTPGEAQTLLTRLLGPDRTRAEPDATAKLARLCGGLPLAVRIAAANAIAHPFRRLGDYAAELAAAGLEALEIDGDAHSAVRTAFDHSYAALPAPARRLFRLLGLVPGPDVTAEVAAAATAVPAHAAGTVLDRLAEAHLLAEYAAGRYAFHDLVRAYAAERAGTEDSEQDRTAALDRVYEYYVTRASAATSQLFPEAVRLSQSRPEETRPRESRPGERESRPEELRNDVSRPEEREGRREELRGSGLRNDESRPEGSRNDEARGGESQPDGNRPAEGMRFADRPEALAWLDAERANLVAATSYAAAHGRPAFAWRLSDATRSYLNLGRHLVDWATVADAGLAAAIADGNEAAQAAGRLSLAQLAACQGQADQAMDGYREAIELARRSGWRDGETAALSDLAVQHGVSGRLSIAADYLEQAAAVCRPVALRAGLSANLGSLCRRLGQLERTAVHYAEARRLFLEAASSAGAAHALAGLGDAHYALGRYEEALAELSEALEGHRLGGDRNTEPQTVRVLAELHRDAGRLDDAMALAEEAEAIFHQTREHAMSAALATQASVHQYRGDRERAEAVYRQAVETARAESSREAEVEALIGLAVATMHTSDEAAKHADVALGISREVGYRLLEGDALIARAAIYLAHNEPEPAARTARAAVGIHTQTGYRIGAARAHLVLAAALRRSDRPNLAEEERQRAEKIFTDLGVPVEHHERALR